jgi:hypothetical protein
LALAQNPNLLAQANRTWLAVFRYGRLGHPSKRNWRTMRIFQGCLMTRGDWLFLLSVVWFVGLLAAAVWILFGP